MNQEERRRLQIVAEKAAAEAQAIAAEKKYNFMFAYFEKEREREKQERIQLLNAHIAQRRKAIERNMKRFEKERMDQRKADIQARKEKLDSLKKMYHIKLKKKRIIPKKQEIPIIIIEKEHEPQCLPKNHLPIVKHAKNKIKKIPLANNDMTGEKFLDSFYFKMDTHRSDRLSIHKEKHRAMLENTKKNKYFMQDVVSKMEQRKMETEDPSLFQSNEVIQEINVEWLTKANKTISASSRHYSGHGRLKYSVQGFAQEQLDEERFVSEASLPDAQINDEKKIEEEEEEIEKDDESMTYSRDFLTPETKKVVDISKGRISNILKKKLANLPSRSFTKLNASMSMLKPKSRSVSSTLNGSVMIPQTTTVEPTERRFEALSLEAVTENHRVYFIDSSGVKALPSNISLVQSNDNKVVKIPKLWIPESSTLNPSC